MRIQAKSFLITAFTALFITLLTVIILKFLIIDYIEKEELNAVQQISRSVELILEREKASLESTALDWSEWDDTYYFIENGNSEYIEYNLMDNTFDALKLNFMAFVDNNGRIVFYKVYDYGNGIPDTLMNNLYLEIQKDEGLLSLDSVDGPNTGVLNASGNIILVSAAPVTTSDGMQPQNGTLIIGRYVDEGFFNYIEKILPFNPQLQYIIASQYNSSPGQNYERLQIGENTTWFNNHEMIAYAPVEDIYGHFLLLLELKSQRQVYQHGIRAVLLFVVLFFTILIIIFLITHAIFYKFIVSRLRLFHGFVEEVGRSGNIKARINLPGKDEISRLAENTNKMLEQLDNSYKDINTMDERLSLIIEATNIGYFDIDAKNGTAFINNEWLKYLGYDIRNNECSYNEFLELIHPDDKSLYLSAMDECIKNREENFRLEFRIKKQEGWVWVENHGKVVQWVSEGSPARIIGLITDISSRKHYEEEILYISYTDIVTGLKNRSYMESVLREEDIANNCNIRVIMGDVNGLKLINDSLGHREGDAVLNTIGGIIKKCCSEDDIAARWGGDEFVIIVRNKDAHYVESLIISIRKECEEVNKYPIRISISMGSAKREKEITSMAQVLTLAEERMYRNKLLESRSARSAIISSLEQSLHERHIETKEHTQRMKEMCDIIGKSMNLSQEELDELTLLAVLHDIGKIAIPEAILQKPGKLNSEEWEIMKKHSEIGYRIAISTPELTHVAEEILSHHERYDGAGYPRGLKEDEIPKLSRLLTIVDSYDVMINGRHYREALDLESVIAEIEACSGKQYDPVIAAAFLQLVREEKLN